MGVEADATLTATARSAQLASTQSAFALLRADGRLGEFLNPEIISLKPVQGVGICSLILSLSRPCCLIIACGSSCVLLFSVTDSHTARKSVFAPILTPLFCHEFRAGGFPGLSLQVFDLAQAYIGFWVRSFCLQGLQSDCYVFRMTLPLRSQEWRCDVDSPQKRGA